MSGSRSTSARAASLALAAILLGAGMTRAAEPAPPYPPPPRTYPAPPRSYYPPPPPAVAPPPPLSPVVRAIYAPFYAAGLVVRYGVYYLIVAPIEVFSRTLTYGAEGGVEPRERAPSKEKPQ
jgi:hypothetical protein